MSWSSVLSGISGILNIAAQWKQRNDAYKFNKQQAETAKSAIDSQYQAYAKQLEDNYNQQLNNLQRQQAYLILQTRINAEQLRNQGDYELAQKQLQGQYQTADYYNTLFKNQLEYAKLIKNYQNELNYLNTKAVLTAQEYQARAQKAQTEAQDRINEINARIAATESERQKRLSLLSYEQKLYKIKAAEDLRQSLSKVTALTGSEGVELTGSTLAKATAIANAVSQSIAQQAGLYANQVALYNTQYLGRENVYRSQIGGIQSETQTYTRLLGIENQQAQAAISKAYLDTQLGMQYATQVYPLEQSILSNRYNYNNAVLNNTIGYLQNKYTLEGQQQKAKYIYTYNSLTDAIQNLYTNYVNSLKAYGVDANIKKYSYSIKSYEYGQAIRDNTWLSIQQGIKTLGGLV